MNLNFEIKKFTGTEHFQSELKILDSVTEWYTNNVKLVDDLTSAKQVLLLLKCHNVLAFTSVGTFQFTTAPKTFTASFRSFRQCSPYW